MSNDIGLSSGRSGTDPEPREQRSARLFVTTMWREMGPVEVRVRNISSRGVGLRATPTPKKGEKVELVLGCFGRVRATVLWADRATFGVILDDAIDPDKIKFSDELWRPSLPPEHAAHSADPFKPATSSWRPGFKVR